MVIYFSPDIIGWDYRDVVFVIRGEVGMGEAFGCSGGALDVLLHQ